MPVRHPLISLQTGNRLSSRGGATSHGGIGETHLHGFDTATGRLLYEMPPKDQRIGLWDAKVMHFRPDSKTLLVATGGGDVIHFNALTGEQLKKMLADYRTPEQIQAGKPREPQLWCGAFSADGKTLVSSSAEWIYVWDADTAALRLQIRHPHDHGCNMCLAPDGKTLATADLLYAGDYGSDAIRLYDIETGDEVLALEPESDRAQVLSFSADGKRLLTGFARGSAVIWDVDRGGE
jgi:WD40 repeat protein